jgi:hypothetical protein
MALLTQERIQANDKIKPRVVHVCFVVFYKSYGCIIAPPFSEGISARAQIKLMIIDL